MSLARLHQTFTQLQRNPREQFVTSRQKNALQFRRPEKDLEGDAAIAAHAAEPCTYIWR